MESESEWIDSSEEEQVVTKPKSRDSQMVSLPADTEPHPEMERVVTHEEESVQCDGDGDGDGDSDSSEDKVLVIDSQEMDVVPETDTTEG